jgi:hypothetical protein
MLPSAIGVPVAGTPGLVPHCDVLTDPPAGLLPAVAGAVGVLPEDVLPEDVVLDELLQPTRATVTVAAASIVLRTPGARIEVLMLSHLLPSRGE